VAATDVCCTYSGPSASFDAGSSCCGLQYPYIHACGPESSCTDAAAHTCTAKQAPAASPPINLVGAIAGGIGGAVALFVIVFCGRVFLAALCCPGAATQQVGTTEPIQAVRVDAGGRPVAAVASAATPMATAVLVSDQVLVTAVDSAATPVTAKARGEAPPRYSASGDVQSTPTAQLQTTPQAMQQGTRVGDVGSWSDVAVFDAQHGRLQMTHLQQQM
jgi:hypothetical protein